MRVNFLRYSVRDCHTVGSFTDINFFIIHVHVPSLYSQVHVHVVLHVHVCKKKHL